MRHLRLYPTVPTTAVEREPALDRDALPNLPAPVPQPPARRVQGKDCQRCDLGSRPRTVCIPDDGEPGGLLVIGEGPGTEEDWRQRNFIGKSGQMLRRFLAKHWKGPVAFSNATRCMPTGTEIEAKHVEACRGYLAQTLTEVMPTRVITLGNWAAQAVTGRSHAVLTNRRTYAYLYDTDPPVPVFHLTHPAAALRNRFVEAWWFDDMQWALVTDPPMAPLAGTFGMIETPRDAWDACMKLREAGRVVFDCETAGDMHNPTFRLLCVGLCGPGGKPAFAWDAKALADPACVAPLRGLLEDPDVEKLGQNVKYDVGSVHLGLGIRVRGVAGDCRLWHKLLESDSDASLDRMAELVGMGGTKEDQKAAMLPLVARIKIGIDTEKNLLPKRALQPNKKWPKLHHKRVDGLAALAELDAMDPVLGQMARAKGTAHGKWQNWGYALAPPEVLVPYCVRDAVATARVSEREEAQLLEMPDLDRLRRKIVDKAARVVSRVEEWGFLVDMHRLRAFDVELQFKLDTVAKQVFEFTAPTFNPDSVPQLRKLLFEQLGLPSIKLTDNDEESTDRDVLEALEERHPIVHQIIEWRRLKKMRGTYASGMIRHVRADGRVHTSLLPDGARSGRWSSKDPNMQNLPRNKDDKGHTEGKTARDVFIAPEGWDLWSFDFSQIELRVAALLSGDPVMIELFRDPATDFHLSTAQSIARTAWGIAPEDVQKEHRYAAKTVVFSSLYGAGDASVAKKCKVSLDDARRIREAIFGKLHVLQRWTETMLAQARRTGYVWTYWQGQKARRRSLWKLADHDELARSRAEHGSWNTPIQGTAGDYNTASLCEAIDWIDREGLADRVHLILPIHDQLVFEVRKDYGAQIVDPIRRIMTGWGAGPVPLVVDVECGPSLGSLEPWPPPPKPKGEEAAT